MASKYTYTVGRRKTSSAQVKLYEGAGDSTINGLKMEEYFKRKDLFDTLLKPLKLCGVKSKVYFDVKVEGGGVSAQAAAIAYGLAKALKDKEEGFKKTLKEAELLTRDARKVERKKPGKHKARKSMQWSKR